MVAGLASDTFVADFDCFLAIIESCWGRTRKNWEGNPNFSGKVRSLGQVAHPVHGIFGPPCQYSTTCSHGGQPVRCDHSRHWPGGKHYCCVSRQPLVRLLSALRPLKVPYPKQVLKLPTSIPTLITGATKPVSRLKNLSNGQTKLLCLLTCHLTTNKSLGPSVFRCNPDSILYVFSHLCYLR